MARVKYMKSRKTLKYFFAAYVLLMVWLLFFRYRGVLVTDYWAQAADRVNLVPFASIGSMLRTLREYPRLDVLWVVVYNLGGNIVMFIPLGFFLPALWEKFRSLLRCLGAVAVIMAGVEFLQLLTLRGFCEIDDVMLNLTGAAIGYGVYKIWKR